MTQPKKPAASASPKSYDLKTLNSIARRAHYFAVQMIHIANHRSDKEKGDPKVGGHPAASASALHILGSLHLVVKSSFDHIAVKPHASPADHSYNFLLNLFLEKDLSRMEVSKAEQSMHGLRAFSKDGEPVFQSYHSAYDSDHHNFLPSGTVGIPPVNAGYLALAYRYAREHGYEVPEGAHFWSLIGDSEFREGSLYEAMPDFAERELNNVTWIVDYNRQSLDGQRITNKSVMNGTDDQRLERTALANGWNVIQVRHGTFRLELFKRKGGQDFQTFLENELEDFELQALLLSQDMKAVRGQLQDSHPHLKAFLSSINDEELKRGLHDMGGHDFTQLITALETSKQSKKKPTLVIAHTIKGWGLKHAAFSANHSSLPHETEVQDLRKFQGLNGGALFTRFTDNTPEGTYLKKRGDELYEQILEQHKLKDRNRAKFQKQIHEHGELPPTFQINTKMASYPHTQWMLGQITAKLTRIANTPLDEKQLAQNQKALTDAEKPFKTPSELLISMAPDVGTSTNLNPAMDGKIFGSVETEDYEAELQVKDEKSPDLIPGQEKSDRFLRFDIAECNVMSCVGSFGRMRDVLGIPLVPLMTVYDFFIKRALDQYFYNLYWKSSFILVGTPSGVTLSPEGAQHGWKSDIQIPNQITWEPFFCQELDWILADSLIRHYSGDNEGRNGVLIRGTTRGVDQNIMMKYLKKQRRFKENLPQDALLCLADKPLEGATDESQVSAVPETQILETLRPEVLKGGYYLIDYRGYAGYEAGDNVVNLFAMGALGTEAVQASEELLARGIYANVIIVTSSDLLVGIQAAENDYSYLKNDLGINGDLHIRPTSEMSAGEFVTVAGRRIPAVSVHDGEAGLLDNIGSILGVRQECLAVRKHSKCGRPSEVYAYHHIDAASVVEAAGKVLAETALEKVQVHSQTLSASVEQSQGQQQWQELWPRTFHS